MTAPQTQVYDSADDLASGVAQAAIDVLASAVRERGVAHLVLTGGGILEAVLAGLAQPEAVDWAAVHVWWGDERYVPAGSDERNDVPAAAKFLDRVPLDPSRVHRMPASDAGYPDVDAAAAAYAAELAEAAGSDASPTAVPAFDVALLGIGPDGHCCSLFPHHPGTRRLDTTVIGVENSPKPPPTRMSLTFPALDVTREVWFVASGDGKADAVSRALGGAGREDVPSAGPRGTVATRWLLDRDAAAKLPG